MPKPFGVRCIAGSVGWFSNLAIEKIFARELSCIGVDGSPDDGLGALVRIALKWAGDKHGRLSQESVVFGKTGVNKSRVQTIRDDPRSCKLSQLLREQNIGELGLRIRGPARGERRVLILQIVPEHFARLMRIR